MIILFIILTTIFTSSGSSETKSDLTTDGEIVLNKLTNDPAKLSLLNSNELIEEKIENLDNMDYEEIKSILGVEKDFCIFIEDTNGQVVELEGMNSGIGSDKISINGNPCG